jgi:formate/nitrite transporter FocA (FNT family)
LSPQSKPATPEERASKDKEEERRPDLDPEEQSKAEEEESLNANITYEAVRREGDKELSRPASALFWAALAGGMSMGFSFLTEGLLRSHLPDTEWRPLVTRLGYPVGFLIISLASQQLFTENTITPIVPLLVARTSEMLERVGRLWIIVLAGNLLGALAFASLVGLTDAFEPKAHVAFAAMGHEALRSGFAATFVRAVFAGWLIALMVWMMPAASSEQVTVIIIMTYLVGLGGLAHIIVGSVEVLYLVVTGAASVGTYLMGFMIPALLGNILGGLTLVTGLNHAQVTAGGGRSK